MSAQRYVSDTQKLERRNRELSILNTIASALNREVDLTRALDAALAQVAELLDLQTGWIWLLQVEAVPYSRGIEGDHHPCALTCSRLAAKAGRSERKGMVRKPRSRG